VEDSPCTRASLQADARNDEIDFRKLYAESSLLFGNKLKIQAGEINSKRDRSVRETVGGRDHCHSDSRQTRYRDPGAPIWERMERQQGLASCQRPPGWLRADLNHDFSGQLSLRIRRGNLRGCRWGPYQCRLSPGNHQATFSCLVACIRLQVGNGRALFTCPWGLVATDTRAHSAAWPSNGPRQTMRR